MCLCVDYEKCGGNGIVCGYISWKMIHEQQEQQKLIVNLRRLTRQHWISETPNPDSIRECGGEHATYTFRVHVSGTWLRMVGRVRASKWITSFLKQAKLWCLLHGTRDIVAYEPFYIR